MAAGAQSPWKQRLLKAVESNSKLEHASFLQLATIGVDGRPSNRTLICRGFLENTDRIQLNTDTRTRKIEELQQCPFAEICWYFTDTWEQFRINGGVDVIDGSNPDPLKLQLREKSWFARPVEARLMYLGPTPDQHSTEYLDPCTGPADTFCLLVLDPEKVEYYNVKSNERIMFTFGPSVSGERCWSSEAINP